MTLIVIAYFLAQVLHMLAVITVSIKSKLNALHGVRDYLALRWPPLLGRLLLNTACFILVWTNPKMAPIQDFAVNMAAKIALAFIFGWFGDSLFDKVIGLLAGFFPNMQKEAPVVAPPPEEEK